MADEKVSVIVPVYNVEKYLRRCLDSIVNQTYRNLEIILVDDGSPDNSGAICDEYAGKDDRIQVIHQGNGGLSAARNTGLDVATGAYVSFVDSDDWLQDEFVEKLYEKAEENTLVIANLVFWKSDTRKQVAMLPSLVEEIDHNEFWRRTTGTECTPYIIACGKLYPKAIFRRLRFAEGLFHEDEAILHYVISQVKCIHLVYDAHYYYRQNDCSIMGRGFNPRRLDGFVAWAERLRYFREHSFAEAEEALACKYWTRYKDQIMAISPAEDPEKHRKKAIQTFKIAFPSLLNAKSITTLQKISIIAMRISPWCFYYMWKIVDLLRKHK